MFCIAVCILHCMRCAFLWRVVCAALHFINSLYPFSLSLFCFLTIFLSLLLSYWRHWFALHFLCSLSICFCRSSLGPNNNHLYWTNKLILSFLIVCAHIVYYIIVYTFVVLYSLPSPLFHLTASFVVYAIISMSFPLWVFQSSRAFLRSKSVTTANFRSICACVDTLHTISTYICCGQARNTSWIEAPFKCGRE